MQILIGFLISQDALGDLKRGSYPELVDALTQHGAKARTDAAQLYRRVTFNVLVSNVDDHLRNHGFLWAGRDGWVLSPAYDLNPTPTDVKARILTTNIDLDEGTCSVGLLENAAEFFLVVEIGTGHDPRGGQRHPDMAGGCSGGRLQARRDRTHGKRVRARRSGCSIAVVTVSRAAFERA